MESNAKDPQHDLFYLRPYGLEILESAVRLVFSFSLRRKSLQSHFTGLPDLDTGKLENGFGT